MAGVEQAAQSVKIDKTGWIKFIIGLVVGIITVVGSALAVQKSVLDVKFSVDQSVINQTYLLSFIQKAARERRVLYDQRLEELKEKRKTARTVAAQAQIERDIDKLELNSPQIPDIPGLAGPGAERK